ncbi:MAG TPA: PKD domain-containing protein, partial [Solirubrobacteraceae bacterium]
DNRETINSREGRENGAHGELNLEPYTAGSPITQLTNNLYATRYGYFVQNEPPPDGQSALAPWSLAPGLEAFWTQGVVSAHGASAHNVANEAIRLFEANGKLVATIGGQPIGQGCSLDSERLALAAGAEGSVFVLSQPNSENGDTDDQVIEFAPGGSGKCPTPPTLTGQVKVNGTAASTATVTQGKAVKFDASSIDRAGETPYELDWNFEGKTTGGTAGEGYDLGSKIEGPNYKWPNPEAEYTYGKAGVYEASVRMIGDYGTSVFPVKITVEPTTPAVAAFIVPSSIKAEESVTFDGKESKPTPESKILVYRWEFGDGTSPQTSPTPLKSHTFASAGAYKVKLKITDESGETAEVTHEVTVAAPKSKEEPPATKPKEEPPTIAPPLPGPGPTPVVLPSIKPKPLTNAQKLAIALKACKKKKSKQQRAGCVKQARSRYAPKPKAKAKKKSTKKK